MPRTKRPPKAPITPNARTPGYCRFQVTRVARDLVNPDTQSAFGTTSFAIEDYNHSAPPIGCLSFARAIDADIITRSVPARRRPSSCHHDEISVTAFQTSIKTKLSASSSGKVKIIFASPNDFIQIVEHVRCHGSKRSSPKWSCPLDGCEGTLSNFRSFDILRHFLSHIPDQFQPYKCRLPNEVCQNTAVQENNFLCHMRTHGLEEKARCAYWLPCGLPCSYTTNDNGELSKHRSRVTHCDYPGWINGYYKDKNKIETSRKARAKKKATAMTKGKEQERIKMEVETQIERKWLLPLPPGYTWEVPGQLQAREPPETENNESPRKKETRATQTYEEDPVFAANMSSTAGHSTLVIVLTSRPTVMLTEHDPSEISASSGGKVSFGCQVNPLEEIDKDLPTIRGRPDPFSKLPDVDRSLMLVKQFLVEKAEKVGLQVEGNERWSPVSDWSTAASHRDSGVNTSTEIVVDKIEDGTITQTDTDVDDLMGVDRTDTSDTPEDAELFTDMDVDSDLDSHIDSPIDELKPTVHVPAERELSRSEIDTADNRLVHQSEPQENDTSPGPGVSNTRTRYTTHRLPTPPWLANERPVLPPQRTLRPLPIDRVVAPSTIDIVAPRAFVHIPTPPWVAGRPPSPLISPASTSISLDDGSPRGTPSTAAISRAPTPPWLSRHSSTISPSPLPTPSPLDEKSPLVASDSSEWSDPSSFVRNLPLVSLPGSSFSLPSVLLTTRRIVSPSPVEKPSRSRPACELAGQRQWDPSLILSSAWLSSSNPE